MGSSHDEIAKLIKKVQKAEERWYRYPRVCWTETSGDVKFEIDKADVVFRLTNRVCFPGGIRAEEVPLGIRNLSESIRCAIEIKPTVGDNLSSILRQMNISGAKYLFVGEYNGIGMNVEQFRDMFASNEKIVVFKWEVDEIHRHRMQQPIRDSKDDYGGFGDLLDGI